MFSHYFILLTFIFRKLLLISFFKTPTDIPEVFFLLTITLCTFQNYSNAISLRVMISNIRYSFLYFRENIRNSRNEINKCGPVKPISEEEIMRNAVVMDVYFIHSSQIVCILKGLGIISTVLLIFL